MSSATVAAAPAPSAWAPFRHGAFALLWTATLFSNVGTWMHDVGAGWLMTQLDPTPAVVTLVQAATTLPVFLFALFAGTLADCFDKKRMLIIVNALLLVVVGALAALVAAEAVTPLGLLVFTFLIGTGASWAEHLRQHDRVTKHDADVQAAVRRFHKRDDAPKVRHLLAPRREASVPVSLGAPQSVPAP